MMVQATKDMGEDSASPTNSHSTPIHTQPSSSKPQKKKSRRKERKDNGPTEPIPDEAINEEYVATPSCDPPQSVTLVDETQEMNDENLMFDTDVLKEHEEEVAKKEVSAVDPVTTAGEVVTTANVEVTTANSPPTTIDELTLAQTLIGIKRTKTQSLLHLLLQQLQLQDPRLEGL
ncbi:hypothetical protein Tco_1540639 [Tanacetum coccineum]